MHVYHPLERTLYPEFITLRNGTYSQKTDKIERMIVDYYDPSAKGESRYTLNLKKNYKNILPALINRNRHLPHSNSIRQYL